ncbi:hypothetical protein VTK26DRAFT_2707 [Humicola hyalothermophila]
MVGLGCSLYILKIPLSFSGQQSVLIVLLCWWHCHPGSSPGPVPGCLSALVFKQPTIAEHNRQSRCKESENGLVTLSRNNSSPLTLTLSFSPDAWERQHLPAQVTLLK